MVAKTGLLTEVSERNIKTYSLTRVDCKELSNDKSETSEKVLFIWEGKVQNPSDASPPN